MHFISDNRASRILYNFLTSNVFGKPFLVPCNVCGVIPTVFEESGVDFVFGDINSNSLCLDLEWLLKHEDEFAGVLFIHTYGTEREFNPEFEAIKQIDPHFIIIDDRCLCLPSFFPSMSNIDLCLFSVGEKKQVDCNRGGFAFINDGLSYRTCTLKSDSFMDDSSWTLDRELILEKTRHSIDHRNLINSIYLNLLPEDIQLNKEFQNWRFNILVDNKEDILKALFSNGLFASSHYHPAIVSQSFFNTNNLHQRVINLFNDYHYTEEMAINTCSIINGLL